VPRAGSPTYWVPRLATLPSGRKSWLRSESLPFGARVTPYRVLLAPWDQDTTSWSPSLTLPSPLDKRARDITGTSFPASNDTRLTTAGGRRPAEPYNTRSTHGENNHTHYELIAIGTQHDALHTPHHTGQPHPGNHPRLDPGTRAAISQHTRMQTHDSTRESNAQNYPVGHSTIIAGALTPPHTTGSRRL